MSDERCRATLDIVNRLGLHARAAVLLVQAANQFEATVTVTKGDQSVDGRSIMGVMMLAAEQGSTIDVETVGPQAREALDAIAALVANKFNEAE
jgi:phosphotransferase system HPr (HPr) family protein